MNILIKEIKKFSKENWWVFVMFFICLFLIYITNSWNLLEVSTVFWFHFLWDLCVMIMWNYYANNENDKALKAQTGSFIIFGLIWIYTGLTSWKWNYLIPQLLFCWPIIKWYFPKIKFIDYKFISFIWILVLILYFSFGLINNIWIFIQILWFIIFPISLVINNEKIKYFWSLIWIIFIFLGSITFLYNGFIEKNIIWTDLSYTLLPLTVVVFYLKNIKKYLK